MQGLANRCDCVEHIAQFVHVGHCEFSNGGFIAHVFGKAGAFTQRKAQT